jgi:hypothetical protein
MRIRGILALLSVALVTAAIPVVAAADDPGSAVQADLAVLANDVRTFHDTLLPDIAAVTTAARNGDRPGLRSALAKLSSDRRAVSQAVLRDRHQLRSDMTAATAAGATGLNATVEAAVVSNHLLLRDVRIADRLERRAVQLLRGLSPAKSS